MSNGPAVTECVISAAPDVQIRCSAALDGSIDVQTQLGSINILLRHAETRASPHLGPSGRVTLWHLSSTTFDHEGASFCFSSIAGIGEQQLGGEDFPLVGAPASDEVNDDATNDTTTQTTPTNDKTHASSNSDAAEQAKKSNEPTKPNKPVSKPKKRKKSKTQKPIQLSEQDIESFCTSLANKITAESAKAEQETRNSLNELLSDLSTFFGRTSFDSPEQFAYHSLRATEGQHKLYQDPFHKMLLAIFRNQCLGETPTAARKAAMYEKLEPGFTSFSRETKNAKYKQFGRHTKQGDVLLLMAARNAGLVLTISRFITTDEYGSYFA
jgi:hypothetical protein